MYNIESIEDLERRIYIALKVKKGTFLYNRDLGSNLHTLDTSSDEFYEQCKNMTEEALAEFKQIDITDITPVKDEIGFTIVINYKYLNQKLTTEVKISG